jgi:DNA-binding NtrC family response regulator
MSRMKTVLIIDDEQRMAESLRELLAQDGYDVSMVNSGSEAIPLLSKRRFSVVVTDLRMPGVGGIDIIKYLP